MTPLPVLLVVAFLVGSVPFAHLVLRGRGVDLRAVGSGNVGAANVLRVSTPRMAAFVVALDACKGVLAVWLADAVGHDQALRVWAGLAAIAGHSYPPWLGFRGGKGMATSGGVFVVLAPLATAAAAVVFVVIVWLSRYVSLGSLAAMLSLPPLVAVLGAPPVVVAGACAAAAFVAARHHANIRRLLHGTERRIGQHIGVN